MKKRFLSLFLALVTLLGILPAASLPALAASTVEDALGEIDIFNGGQEMGYLSINGAVRKQEYTYYIYHGPNGRVRETPAYCVNPTVMGVPQTVAPSESIKYIANEKASDPKVVGIVCSGYQPGHYCRHHRGHRRGLCGTVQGPLPRREHPGGSRGMSSSPSRHPSPTTPPCTPSAPEKDKYGHLCHLSGRRISGRLPDGRVR